MSDKSNQGSNDERLGVRKTRRVRKGTRSCWECKRRKIGCLYATDNDSTCRACTDRGTACVSQEFVDEAEHHPAGNGSLGHRMGRVEDMLEKLMQKVSMNNVNDGQPEGSNPRLLPPRHGSMGTDMYSKSSSLTPLSDQNAQIGSLYENSLFIRSADEGSRSSMPTQMPTPGSIGSSTSRHKTSKLELLRRTLCRLIPTQKDTDIILKNCQSWWYIKEHCIPNFTFDNRLSTSPFNVEIVATCHPNAIARFLLSMALCIHQFPPNFDSVQLEMSLAPFLYMEKVVGTVQSLVTSDDDVIGTIEGLECLNLLGVFHFHAGNLRRAWLAFRKGVNLAQLMGIHRCSAQKIQSGYMKSSDPEDIRRGYVYFQVVKGDLYLALLLGVPSSLGKDPFSGLPHDFMGNAGPEEIYVQRLCTIYITILDRNSSIETAGYAETQRIDEALDTLKLSFPPEWWIVPVPTSLHKRSVPEIAKAMQRSFCQLGHFQAEALVHLPFMLRCANDRRYEYNKFRCLNANRDLIRRWFVLRGAGKETCVVCHLVDFQAFTAAVTLLLGLTGNLADPSYAAQHDEDRRLVQALTNEIELLGATSRNVLAVQCVDLLKTLMAQDLSRSSLRLTIPYFGTLSLAPGMGMHASTTDDNFTSDTLRPESLNQMRLHLTTLPTHIQGYGADNIGIDPSLGGPIHPMGGSMVPALAFSSSQFPTDDGGMDMEWNFGNADVIFFDSLGQPVEVCESLHTSEQRRILSVDDPGVRWLGWLNGWVDGWEDIGEAFLGPRDE